jgi:hypothetical protein
MLDELIARFKNDERLRREFKDVVEWLGLFLIIVVALWIVK